MLGWYVLITIYIYFVWFAFVNYIPAFRSNIRMSFKNRRFYTHTLLHTSTFTHKHFYTQTLLHRRFYTQTLFTHRPFYTQELLHFYTDAFTYKSFYPQKLLQTEAFTHYYNWLANSSL